MIHYPYRYKLKPIEKCFNEEEIDLGTRDSGVFRSSGWTVNTHMSKRFGDGKFHRFKDAETSRLITSYTHKTYTHISDDGFFYHESWFECDDVPVLELNDKDFLL